MRFTPEAFRAWPDKAVTLLGMSGVGKTFLAKKLREAQWFHYSADYRIGSRYLDEPILDNIKSQAMQVPFLRDLLRNDSIHIYNNLSVDNLQPVSSFLGKVGNPELGGLPLKEFKRRQALHLEAEIRALGDVPQFISKAQALYGYRCFVNDAGGSACEIEAPEVLAGLAQHTLVLYIQATDADETRLIERARSHPKPLYYRPDFLDQQLTAFMRERELGFVALVDPDDFVRWVFPRLYHARLPRYQAITAEYGYAVSSAEVACVRDEVDFIDLVASALARSPD